MSAWMVAARTSWVAASTSDFEGELLRNVVSRARPYFHYNIFGSQYDDGCSSGLAEILGNDFVVTLGCWTFTQGQQRGTFVHEFGHNLNLTHFGNGNNNGNNSVLHNSVMNYRYQIGGTSPSGRHTYSFGGGEYCAPCTTSPKQACIDLNNLGQCGTPDGTTCDCDLNEWSSAIDYDMTEGGNLNDGAGYTAPPSTRPAVAEPIDLYDHLDWPRQSIRHRNCPYRRASWQRRVRGTHKAGATKCRGQIDVRSGKGRPADVSYNLAGRAGAAPKPNLQRRQASGGPPRRRAQRQGPRGRRGLHGFFQSQFDLHAVGSVTKGVQTPGAPTRSPRFLERC